MPTIFVDVDATQASVLNVALNQIQGTFDHALLGHLLADLQAQPEVDLSLTGFATADVAALVRSLERQQRRDRPETFDLEVALTDRERPESRVQAGDVWQCGAHRVGCGDATDAEAVAALIASGPAAMAFTDPPYNVDYGRHGGQQRGQRTRTIANDAMPATDFAAFCAGWAANLVGAVEGALYVCMSDLVRLAGRNGAPLVR